MSEHVLKDGRTLLLRAPTQDDAELLISFLKIVGGETDFLLCDENGIEGLTIDSERAFIAATLEAPNASLFLGFVDSELAAVFDVRALARSRAAHNAALALSIRRDYWRLGIGGIAMQTMIDFARGTGAIRNLCLEVREGNGRAIALYERFGFKHAGRHENRICVRGEYFDELLMDLAL